MTAVGSGPGARAPRRRWPRALVGALLALAVLWSVATQGGGIVHSHPAYLTVCLVTAYAALKTLLFRPRPTARPRVRAAVLGLAGALALTVVVAARPATADDVAARSTEGGATVAVHEDATTITLMPRSGKLAGPVGVAFYAGGFVDPRAYVPLLSQVAAKGYPVVVLKPPMGLALLSVDALERARARAPEVRRWVLGGHSLGGVRAASDVAADPAGIAGLLLWASYPGSSMATVTMPTLVVYGTRDGLSTPEKIKASVKDLPRGAKLVAIPGAIHGYFGDYGTQRGDGTPAATRAVAQRQIVAATLAWLATLR